MTGRRIALLLVAVAVVAAWFGGAPGTFGSQEVWRLDRSGPITYFIAEASAETGYRPGDRQLAEWALQAWAVEADPPLELVPGPESSALLRVYWVGAADGLYGEMRRRTSNGRPAADVFVHPDMAGLGPDVASVASEDSLFRATIVYLTCVHELGHAFGLPHTSAFADIMYSFQYGGDVVAYFMRFRDQLEARADIPRASPFSAADSESLLALYR